MARLSIRRLLPLERRQSPAEGRVDRVLMARSLALLFLAGGTLSLASLALPQGMAVDEPRMVATATVAYAVALVIALGWRRLPSWVFQVFLAGATVPIEWAIWASGDSTSPYAMFYFWIAIYAFYFFTRAQAAVQVLFILLAYSAIFAFVDDPSSSEMVDWAITTSALVVAGAMIGLLKEHLDRVIARLAEAARTDTLTGLLNRRGFSELFDKEVERARRGGHALTLIVGDLDGFKAVNDRFGHHQGDAALEQVSRALVRAKRRIDTAARIGGEEFAVLVPETHQGAAYVLAERLRREVAEEFRGDELDLTISLGLASFGEHGRTTQELMRAADQALYAAKALGRDRAVIYHEEIAANLEALTGRRTGRADGHLATVLALAEELDAKGHASMEHCRTVADIAEATARELRLPPEQVERVRLGGIVHDLGKIGVSEAVLRNPGELTEADWAEMRKHPEIGARILDGASLDDIASWVRAHHERPDGRGYPHGLRGDEIPLGARILAAADAYEAMTTDRIYRRALGPEQAAEELLRGAGSQFDAAVVEALLRAVGRPGAEALERSAL